MYKLKIKNLTIKIINKQIISNLSLSLKSGELLAITGKSGVGKSILVLSILGFIQKNIEVKGDIERNYNNVSILFQNPKKYIFSETVYEELKNSSLKSNVDKEFFKNIVDLWSLKNILYSKLNDLSKKDQQKVAFASMVLSKSDFIILDEASQYVSRDNFEENLILLRKNLKDSIFIIIEHDYELLNEISDNILLLEENFFTFKDKLSIPKYNIIESKKNTEKALEIDSLYFNYFKNKPLLEIDNLIVNKGELLQIKGENSSGKTTLAYLIARIIKHKKGKIIFFDKLINPKLKKIRKYIAYIFQNPDNQIFATTVREEIAYSNNGLINENTKNWIKNFQLEEFLEISPHLLSYGERKRLNILAACSHNPKIIIYDEVSSGLDYENKKILLDFIKENSKNYVTQIIITNDLWFESKIKFDKIINL